MITALPRVVLIGEATHGTHEFYRTRAELTEALIQQKGFDVVAVEADWPDAYRANRWVRHEAEEPNADAALGNFSGYDPAQRKRVRPSLPGDERRLAEQFDAVLHIDETHALKSLEAWAVDEVDLPETYPSAL